jgi:5-(carboxyamino)imidazole ribonucleotide mutase
MSEGSSDRGPVVGIVMGSDSDWPVMKAAATALGEFDVPFEADVVSAHRMPEEMLAYGKDAAGRGLRVLIAGAGGAAHLPGMLASVTPLPVIGVPVAIGNARNAGLLAVRILAASDDALRRRMVDFQAELKASAQAKGASVRSDVAPQRLGF